MANWLDKWKYYASKPPTKRKRKKSPTKIEEEVRRAHEARDKHPAFIRWKSTNNED